MIRVEAALFCKRAWQDQSDDNNWKIDGLTYHVFAPPLPGTAVKFNLHVFFFVSISLERDDNLTEDRIGLCLDDPDGQFVTSWGIKNLTISGDPRYGNVWIAKHFDLPISRLGPYVMHIVIDGKSCHSTRLVVESDDPARL